MEMFSAPELPFYEMRPIRFQAENRTYLLPVIIMSIFVNLQMRFFIH